MFDKHITQYFYKPPRHISATFTKFSQTISPKAISYVLNFLNLSNKQKKIWQLKENLKWKTQRQILQHDATFNLQLARTQVGELHMPSCVDFQLQNISTGNSGAS
jgi:galactose-1-phosphate uridylyltransferase